MYGYGHVALQVTENKSGVSHAGDIEVWSFQHNDSQRLVAMESSLLKMLISI